MHYIKLIDDKGHFEFIHEDFYIYIAIQQILLRLLRKIIKLMFNL